MVEHFRNELLRLTADATDLYQKPPILQIKQARNRSTGLTDDPIGNRSIRTDAIRFGNGASPLQRLVDKTTRAVAEGIDWRQPRRGRMRSTNTVKMSRFLFSLRPLW